MNTTGIVEQAKQKQNAWKKWGIIICVLVGIFFTWKHFTDNKNMENAQNYSVYEVQKEDIQISIEADGNIKNKQTHNLFFGNSGTVKEIFVEEGETVTEGQNLAKLDTTDAEFEVEKAKIALASSQANLAQVLAGATQEELAIAQTNTQSARLDLASQTEQNTQAIHSAFLALENAKENLDFALLNANTSSNNDALDSQSAENKRQTAEENVRIALETQTHNTKNYALKIEQAQENIALNNQSAGNAIESAMQEITRIVDTDNDEGYQMGYLFSAQNDQLRRNIENNYAIIRKKIAQNSEENTDKKQLLEEMHRFLSDISKGLENTVIGNNITASQLTGIKANILQKQANISGQITSLTTLQQSLESLYIQEKQQALQDKNAILQAKQQKIDAFSSEEKIESNTEIKTVQYTNSTAEAQRNYEKAKHDYESLVKKAEINTDIGKARINISELQYKQLKKPPRATDTAMLKQQIENNKIFLEQAQYRLSQGYLTAPFSGVLLTSNIEIGDIVQANGGTPHMTLRSDSGFQMYTNVEEADISQVKIGQKTIIYFDALEDVYLDGVVNSIAETANTDANGVVSYRVKVDVDGGLNEGVREGMTSYAKFIIAERNNVFTIPLSAIKNNETDSFIILENGTEQKVSTGLTDGKKVEIISGISENIKIRIPQ